MDRWTRYTVDLSEFYVDIGNIEHEYSMHGHWTLTGAWTSRSDKLNDCQLGWQNMQRLSITLLRQVWSEYSFFAGSIGKSESLPLSDLKVAQ